MGSLNKSKVITFNDTFEIRRLLSCRFLMRHFKTFTYKHTHIHALYNLDNKAALRDIIDVCLFISHVAGGKVLKWQINTTAFYYLKHQLTSVVSDNKISSVAVPF